MLITEKTEKNEKHPLFLKIVKLCIYFSPSQQKHCYSLAINKFSLSSYLRWF